MARSPTTDDPLLSTGDAARLLGSSRQHVVDLCDRGDLPCETVGRHRRIRRSDIVAFQRFPETGGWTKDQLRSLWLHRAVAGKLVTNPDRVLEQARYNLQQLLEIHPRGQARKMLREWERLLDGPVEQVAAVMTTKSQQGAELRQNSPFAGVLTERERTAVLKSFNRVTRRN